MIPKNLRENKLVRLGKDLLALGRSLSSCQRWFMCKLIKYVPRKEPSLADIREVAISG